MPAKRTKPSKSAPKRKTGKPKVARRHGEIEREARRRIVEHCIAVGKLSRKEIQAEFAERGVVCAERTIDGYISDVRKRLREEDEKQRAAYRKRLVNSLVKREEQMLGLLVSNKVVPKWRDLVNLLKLRLRLHEKGMLEVIPAAPLVVPDSIENVDDDELATKSSKELDEMIVEMMSKGGVADVIATADPKDDTVH
jgi:hypothetical protein